MEKPFPGHGGDLFQLAILFLSSCQRIVNYFTGSLTKQPQEIKREFAAVPFPLPIFARNYKRAVQ
jgi:hypothetical protein